MIFFFPLSSFQRDGMNARPLQVSADCLVLDGNLQYPYIHSPSGSSHTFKTENGTNSKDRVQDEGDQTITLDGQNIQTKIKAAVIKQLELPLSVCVGGGATCNCFHIQNTVGGTCYSYTCVIN